MSEELSENAATAIETTAAVAAAGLGLAVAGPVGALAGAAAAPVLTRVGRSLMGHVDRRAEQVLQPAVEELGGVEAFSAQLEARPDLAALSVRAVSEAGRMVFENHVRAMAKVLRDVAAGSINVGPAEDLVDTLATLTPARVVVLKDLRDGAPEEGQDDHWDGHVLERLELDRGQVRGALIGLELTGAVASTGAAYDGGERWRIEPLGLSVLTYLGSVDDEESPLEP